MSGRKFHSGLADGVIFEYKAFKRLPLGLYFSRAPEFWPDVYVRFSESYLGDHGVW